MVGRDALREAPDFGASVDTRFINGVFKSREHLTVALHLEELLPDCELAVPEPVES